VGVTAFAGAMIAPFVVFVSPVARLYWLITGRRLPQPLGWLFPPPRIFVNPFHVDERPAEIRELLERPEYNWEPGPEDMPRWFRAWGFIAQVLRWEVPPRDIAAPLARKAPGSG
jgi:hypothetical protein